MTSWPVRPDPAVPNAARVTSFVDGMDGASRVQTVERLVGRLPGAAAVQTSFGRQTMALDLDETQTGRAALECSLGALGYPPSLLRFRSANVPRRTPPSPAEARA